MDEEKHTKSEGEASVSPLMLDYGMLDMLQEPVCVVDLRADLLFANQAFKGLPGMERSGAGAPLTGLFSSEHAKRIMRACLKAAAGRRRRCTGVSSAAGKPALLDMFLYPMLRGGSVVSIMVYLRRMEEGPSFAENAPGPVMVPARGVDGRGLMAASFPIVRIGRDGAVIDASPSLEAFLGRRLEDLQRNRNLLYRSLGHDDFERVRRALNEVIEGGAALRRIVELRITTASREEKWISCIVYPVPADDEVAAADIIIEDITRIRKLENTVSQMNRIQIIGDLTQGLLHSFNNILNIILSKTQMLLQVAERDMVTDGLGVIEKTVVDGVKQIRRVQDFIGESGSLRDYEVEDIIEIVEDSIEFSKIHFKVENKEKRRQVRIERQYFSQFNVRANTRLLREVFVSMIFKVSSCLRKSGTINIVLRGNGSYELAFMAEKEEMLPEGQCESLAGFYFSGFDVGRMAEKLDIRVVEEDTPAAYTIRALLPSSIIAGRGRKEQDFSGLKVRDLDILIAEDEKALRDILYQLFDSMGNRVHLCESGEEACAEFVRKRYDLVITDYGMKGITGLDVARRVKEINGSVITVLLSGWMLNDLKAYKNVVDLFLPKPFKLDVLIREIAGLLKGRAG